MTIFEVKSPKKLIEVALPLDDINEAAAREKSIRHGHPSTLHLWWARRPLAAARAVLFAQLVNDPGYQRELGFGVNKKEAEAKRAKLFEIIRDLVKWENTNNEEVLQRARDAIWESWRETCHLNRHHPQAAELFNPEKLPASHDPFAGGGAIPLEAQRLGLESYASDLNPVAVMINKAMIEIPPRFAGRAPIGPIPEGEKQTSLVEDWSGAKGLAEDVRRYGHWMREEAFARIGHLYPKVKITSQIIDICPDLKEYEGEELTISAWLWAKTVKSPNPVYKDLYVPLIKSFTLSSKKNQEAYLEPIISEREIKFTIKYGGPSPNKASGTVGRRGAVCLYSNSPIPLSYIREQGVQGLMSETLIAVIVKGRRGSFFLPPDLVNDPPSTTSVESMPDTPIEHVTGCTNSVVYGATKFSDLFTERQVLALQTFSDLINEIRLKIEKEFKSDGFETNNYSQSEDGITYAKAISVYLTCVLGRAVDYWNKQATWESSGGFIAHGFTKQAIPMVWDYAESNPFSDVSGNWLGTALSWVPRVIEKLPAKPSGYVEQQPAQSQNISVGKLISTDPPYYDNVPYAVLSDFFYIWIRRTLRDIYPSIFSTIAVPKAEELVTATYRNDSRSEADMFFLEGMTRAIENLANSAHPAFPVAIYYAFKQSETKSEGTSSTGWVVFLEAVIAAGFSIVGTWPVRTERASRSRSIGANALASSIVLVCRKRELKADSISRRDFQRELREEMPESLEAMLGGEGGHAPIAPVDLAQSAIGPGMAIYSKYAEVLNQDGSRMSVHDALVMINRAIDEYLNPEGESFDADTQFCSSWFEQYGWSSGPFGEADTLARAKGTSVAGAVNAGVVESGGGKVRLLKWAEYQSDWDPTQDDRTPVWEACHYMIRRLNNRGESAAGELLAKMPEQGESIRQLAYHLYTLCERKKWAEEARAYNELILSWSAIVAASLEVGHSGTQTGLDF